MKVAYIKQIDVDKRWKFHKLVDVQLKDNNSIIINTRKIKNKTCIIINRIINKYNIKKVVISKDLRENTKLLESIESIKIVKKRDILIYYIYEMIEYILKIQHIDFYNAEVFVLVNEFSKINVENINLLAAEVKVLNIVTSNLRNFKKYEEEVFKKTGININVTNNKKRGLANARIIVNIDFSEDQLENYNINTNSIIINIKHSIINHKKTFARVNINSIDIDFNDMDEFYSNFDALEVCQVMDKKLPKINGLIGERGIIDESELC
ncbi:MAG: hypothetical protein Q4G05_05280 [Clostridia bacterium]|nr:hypothetical protein [Clostridia bacterium]